MRVILQKVTKASVAVEGAIIAEINAGLLILLGIEEADGLEDIEWLSRKICNLRIFNDEDEVMNKSLLDTKGDAIIVSQFTLHAATKKGNRPSYIKAARTEIAIPLYKQFIEKLEEDLGKKVGTGVFGADMKVALVNDGPVTISIDTKNKE
ncbi:D-aminoacyl-tRNA deacylase [Cellulophaga sp. HaHa_2_1]|uniref:D-aminoacyl-tRNA deacylase n=1 Tax=Cellulophaga sp. HaHa_2_1 TaxID=2749994 RepID=UPI001C4F5A3D|nr:D-aminoacyl-tRNA deacylase [Cellulophaga sp. HaHa_2_1]QXP51686.1 D-tyrosyl-tRNA(Tyr) deacylase [Cellulophaga sp. HaHa_2_1]